MAGEHMDRGNRLIKGVDDVMITRSMYYLVSVCYLGSCLSKHMNMICVFSFVTQSVPDMVIRFFSEDFEGETL